MLFLLISLAFADYGLIQENFADRDSAQAACQAEDSEYSLCTYGQQYVAVMEGAPVAVCWSSFYAEGGEKEGGWWNGDASVCGGVGFKGWLNPAGLGAHCCTADILDGTPAQCSSASNSICVGDRILDEAEAGEWCDGAGCSDDVCCKDFSPASGLYANVGGYAFASGEEAEAGCAEAHPDYVLCSKSQLIALVDADVGQNCQSAWYKDDSNDNFMDRGWYVSEADAEAGYCGGKGGWRSWKNGNGMGSAHCCIPSYANSDYADAAEDILMDCSSMTYHTDLCSYDQMLTVVHQEEPNICKSGILSDLNTDGTNLCGWEQGNGPGDNGCGQAAPGWKGWCSPKRAVHCCLSYVPAYVPDILIVDWDILPSTYSESSFSTGASANQYCLDIGYTGGVCTQAQHKYVAEQAENQTDGGCKVGWVKVDDSYDSGYWGEICGKGADWMNIWQPNAPAYPVAYCCQSEVEESALAPKQFKKENYGQYTSFDQVTECDEGYSLCSRDQVEQIARFGTTDEEGNFMQDDDVCFQGYMRDGSKGWFQESEGCGATGWRQFGGAAGRFCCTEFETDLTKSPYVSLSGTFMNQAEAAAGCAEDPDYELCTDNQVRGVAMDGVEIIGDLEAKYFSLAPQTELCFSGYVSEQSGTYSVGWYQVTEGVCGTKFNMWNPWALGSGAAGAHCCAVDVVVAEDYFPLSTMAPSEMPTPTTTMVETTMAPSEVPTELPTATTADPTSAPTAYVPYSGLPSDVPEPEDCASKPDLTPEGMEGVLRYCSSQETIFLNGVTTCIADDENATANVAYAYENNWDWSADDCDNNKSYDSATHDQLYVTNEALTDLENDIDQLEQDMTAEAADLEVYLDNWTDEVKTLIENSMNNFNQDTQDLLQQYIDENL